MKQIIFIPVSNSVFTKVIPDRSVSSQFSKIDVIFKSILVIYYFDWKKRKPPTKTILTKIQSNESWEKYWIINKLSEFSLWNLQYFSNIYPQIIRCQYEMIIYLPEFLIKYFLTW